MSQELNAARAELADAVLEFDAAKSASEDSEGYYSKLADSYERMGLAEKLVQELEESTPKVQSPLRKRVAYDSDEAIEMIANQQWLIDQVMPADAFGVLYGPSGSYKSFIAMDMSAAIASSMNWHGHDVDETGHVLYIGAEGAAGLHLRKKAWEIRNHKKLKNLAILSSAVTINSGDIRHLIDLCDELVEEIGEPIKLVVIDTLARSFEGEENSATDMGEFVKACDYIRETTGATILVIHHSGKDADKGARGSSALRAACDFEYKVTSPGKKQSKISCTKAKDSDPFEDLAFKLNVVEIGRKDKKGRAMTSLTLTQSGDDLMPAREDLSGSSQIIHNLIATEMSRSGNDFVFYTYLRDTYFAMIGADKKDNTAKASWDRGIKKLIADEWIFKGEGGKITRPEMY